MSGHDQELIESLKKFEKINNRVMQLSRQLSQIKAEIAATKRKISEFNT